MITCVVGVAVAVVSLAVLAYWRSRHLPVDFWRGVVKWVIGYRRHFDMRLRHCRTTPGGPYRTKPDTDLSRFFLLGRIARLYTYI